MIRRFGLVLACVATPALAEDPDIVVTGHGLEEAKGDAAYDIVRIDRDRLTGSASGRLEDVLKDVAGLQQFRRSDARSANPTSQGVTLRGLGGNASSRALVILDGVPQSDPFGGWISWPAFAPGRLDHVRVTRGGGSGALGAGALAGTIELTSAGTDTLPRFGGGVAYGSRESITADATAALPLGAGFATISADYARSDGFIPIAEANRGPADRRAPYEQASVAARAVIPVGEETELQANMLAFTDDRDRGFAFSANGGDGADASLRFVGRGRWGYSALAYLQVRDFYSGFASLSPGRTTATAVAEQYNVPSTGLGARFELRPPVGEALELRLGADWRRTSGVTKEYFFYNAAGAPQRGREAGGHSDTAGAFAELSADLGDALTLTGAARIDRWWIGQGFLRERNLSGGPLITNAVYAARQGWEPTARGGIAYRPLESVTLRAAAYLGWRLPTLNELYRPFRVGNETTQANAALSPERLSGVEAGIDWRPSDSARIGVTVFTNRMKDAIANVTVVPRVTRRRENLDAVRARGVELDASYAAGDLRFAASYAYTESVVRASGLALPLDGLRPAQTPRHMASATLGWQLPSGPAASVTLRYVSVQYEDDLNVVPLRDALTADARILFPITKGLSIEARGENLGNVRVDAARSDDGVIERASPRTLWLGVRIAT
ncbi:TonB-dependent receptor [Sphingomonas colocasiae]|uniref:TonB-dependent receptor n=1 Tax=Sphingomonas colocasiae TaxID=1848973 RepID=A0ABS7PZT1_9SPHN|nr:TonB-dependent receptor [Sphingomonas colocasiae]MBY8826140.1 TonB-dependent receptor [Sphingomonas colocasiae]